MPSDNEIFARDLAVLRGTAGHDLREALNVIHLYAQVLCADESTKKLANPILHGSHRLRGMLEGVIQLLDLGAPEKGPAPLDAALQRLKSVHADFQVADGTTQVALPMGARHLDLVLQALVDNAATHGAGPIRISATENSLCVEDAGPGIEPARRKQVFRLFTRGAQVGERPGVGLALVDRVAFRYGGRVQLDDSELGGLEVRVLLD